MRDVYVVGHHAYVTGYSGWLAIFSVADPTFPYQVGYCETPGTSDAIYVEGDYAYVADGSDGLRVISGTSNPHEVSFYDTLGWAGGVAVSGNYAYVTDGTYDTDGGLRIIDISNPAAPTEAGFYDAPGWAVDVAVAGNYAYVVENSGFIGYAGWLRMVDVSDPAHPTETGFYDTLGWAWDVAVAGDSALILPNASLSPVPGSAGLDVVEVAGVSGEFGACDGLGFLLGTGDEAVYLYGTAARDLRTYLDSMASVSPLSSGSVLAAGDLGPYLEDLLPRLTRADLLVPWAATGEGSAVGALADAVAAPGAARHVQVLAVGPAGQGALVPALAGAGGGPHVLPVAHLVAVGHAVPAGVVAAGGAAGVRVHVRVGDAFVALLPGIQHAIESLPGQQLAAGDMSFLGFGSATLANFVHHSTQVIDLDLPYLGMIGSKTKAKAALDALLDAGVKKSKVERVCSPIGLDIGAVTPAEIAVDESEMLEP